MLEKRNSLHKNEFSFEVTFFFKINVHLLTKKSTWKKFTRSQRVGLKCIMHRVYIESLNGREWKRKRSFLGGNVGGWVIVAWMLVKPILNLLTISEIQTPRFRELLLVLIRFNGHQCFLSQNQQKSCRLIMSKWMARALSRTQIPSSTMVTWQLTNNLPLAQ